MPISFIIKMLMKFQFGKIEKPTREIDKIEHLTIQPNKLLPETTPLPSKLSKSKKILPVNIVDTNKNTVNQFVNSTIKIANPYIENINDSIKKESELKKKNNGSYMHYIVMLIVFVGLYYLYKYWDKVKQIIDNFNTVVKKVFNYILPFVKWIGKLCLNIFINIAKKLYTFVNDTLFKPAYNNISERYNNIIQNVTSFFENMYNFVLIKIESLGSLLTDNLFTILDNILPSFAFKWWTSSFIQGSQKDNRYESVDVMSLNNTEATYSNNEEINSNNIYNLSTFDNLNFYNTSNNKIELPNIDNKLDSKINNIILNQKADDLIVLGQKSKLFASKYQKIKDTITFVDNTLKIDKLQQTVDNNIEIWKNLFA